MFKNQARGTEDKKKKEFVNVSFALSVSFSCTNRDWDHKLTMNFVGSASIRLSQEVHGQIRQIACFHHSSIQEATFYDLRIPKEVSI